MPWQLFAQPTPTESLMLDMPTACLRIGKPRTGPGAKPRSTKAVLASGDTKQAVLKRGKIIIEVDLLLAQEQERKLKWARFMALKKNYVHLLEWRQAISSSGWPGQGVLGPRPSVATPPPSQPSVSRRHPLPTSRPQHLYRIILLL